jgi:hypothetical protein
MTMAQRYHEEPAQVQRVYAHICDLNIHGGPINCHHRIEVPAGQTFWGYIGFCQMGPADCPHKTPAEVKLQGEDEGTFTLFPARR